MLFAQTGHHARLPSCAPEFVLAISISNGFGLRSGLPCRLPNFLSKTHCIARPVLHTHGNHPSCQARQLARWQKSEDGKRFSTGRPQRAKPESWQGVAKSSRKTRNSRFGPPFGALTVFRPLTT